MKWKQKSRIQNLIAKLPSNLSYATYYFFQRNFGGLRNVNPIGHLMAGIKIATIIRQQGQTIDSKTFLEIGTGHQINLPIALWLAGASRIITVDLNPYLKEELVFDGISYMRNHQQEIEKLFEEVESPVFAERLSQLNRVEENLQRLLAMTNIQYLAPADATCLHLESRSVDYHVSYTTLEHISVETLGSILREGKRLLRQRGLFVHCIDFSDHFSHSDRTISMINFLQFSEEEWKHWAGNRYFYQNRLRVDDFARLCRDKDLKILSMDTIVDRGSLEELRKGFPLDGRFRTKSAETNATINAWLVASDGEAAQQP